MRKTLKDWAPHEFVGGEFESAKAQSFSDVLVTVEWTSRWSGPEARYKRWPGTHKNVFNWVELENGYAVGWNENPSIGWSFPVIKLPK